MKAAEARVRTKAALEKKIIGIESVLDEIEKHADVGLSGIMVHISKETVHSLRTDGYDVKYCYGNGYHISW